MTLQRPCWWTRTKAFSSPDGLPHIKILANERSPFLVAPLRLHNLFSGRGCCMVQGIKKFNSTNYSSFSLLDSSKTLLLSTGEREPLVKWRLLAPPRKSMTPSKTLVVPIERHNLVPRREERPWERN